MGLLQSHRIQPQEPLLQRVQACLHLIKEKEPSECHAADIEVGAQDINCHCCFESSGRSFATKSLLSGKVGHFMCSTTLLFRSILKNKYFGLLSAIMKSQNIRQNGRKSQILIDREWPIYQGRWPEIKKSNKTNPHENPLELENGDHFKKFHFDILTEPYWSCLFEI